MSYPVKITDSALADARECARFLRDDQQSPEAAGRWLQGLTDAINSLSQMPRRCPLIPEAEEIGQGLRHLRYHSHRIIFAIDDSGHSVIVLRVYHTARQRLKALDVRAARPRYTVSR